MKVTWIRVLLMCAVVIASPYVWADGPVTENGTPADEVKVQLWPDKVWTDFSREVDRSGTQLNNIIFDNLDNFDLFKWNQNSTSGKININRSVYDNQDILNTYTVSDQFSINLGRNTTEYSIPLVPSVVSPINFNLGVGGKLLVSHVRQIFANNFPQLPKVDDLQGDIDEESRIYDKEKSKWYQMDPSWKPRLSKFWNPLLTIWRIPWTKDGLDKINNGDLISYSSSGFVSVGLESGFLPLKVAPGVDLSVGVGAQAYVKGEFRVTLLKENERFVRVKVTKIRGNGYGLTAGSTTNDIRLVEGFMVLEDKKFAIKISDQKITVIPFKFNFNSEKTVQFDTGFRFDLNDPEAEEAFEKAMRGNLKFAEEVALKNPAVTFLLSREAKEKRKSSSYQLGLKWLYNYGKNRERKDLWIHIQKPDGTRDIFKSSLQLTKAWSTLWGTGEKKNFLFTTLFDETAYLKKETNSFQLVSEALYEDVKTSGEEMHSYIHDIRSVIGDRQELPELPLVVPEEGTDKFKQAKYNRSSFYFGQYFSQKQVTKFIMTPSDQALEITKKSFEYILDPLHKDNKIKKFHKHWMKLQSKFSLELPPEKMVECLQELRLLFKYQGKAINAMRALLSSLDGEEIDFFLSGTNRSFGRIQFRGRIVTNAERLLQLADETVDFENRVGQYRPNLDAKINEFKFEQLPDLKVKVSFTLPKNINYLYFKVLRSSGWKKVKVLRDMIYVNHGRFKEGLNEFIIGPDSKDHLDEAFWETFKTEDYYTVQVSGSPEGQSWGRVESSRFKFKLPEPTKETKD